LLWSSKDDGGGEFARDMGWSRRPPHVGEPRSAGAPVRSGCPSLGGQVIRVPSSLRKMSSGALSSVGLSGGVISDCGRNRLGCRSAGGRFGLDFLLWSVGLRSREPRLGGVPGRSMWIVLGRNLQWQRALPSASSSANSELQPAAGGDRGVRASGYDVGEAIPGRSLERSCTEISPSTKNTRF